MTNLGRGISVMPETILFIGGEVIQGLVADELITQTQVADAGFKFMLHLKDALFPITKDISDMYSQAINQISITVAHDLAYEYLYELAKEVLGLKPKKSQWERIKEDPTLSPSMKAIVAAVEVATDDELVGLFVIYPNLVEAFQNR